jgi:hypothetical protein
MMRDDLRQVLEHLDRIQTRATYGAVAQALQANPRNLGQLLAHHCPLASWVVNKGTMLPTGYSEAEKHPQLESRSVVIEDGFTILRGMLGWNEQRT